MSWLGVAGVRVERGRRKRSKANPDAEVLHRGNEPKSLEENLGCGHYHLRSVMEEPCQL
jgi:hypothetical protein